MSDLDTFIEEQGLTDEVAALEAAVPAVPGEEDGTTGTTESEDEKANEFRKQLNRKDRRDAIRLRGSVQPNRSRIRRRINRIARQKGAWA